MSKIGQRMTLGVGCLLLAACAHEAPMPTAVKIGKPYAVEGKTYVPKYEPDYTEEGEASWYGPGFHGNHTANGEKFDKSGMTAAHRTLPMPSMVRVTNLANDKSVLVRVNDRGPFAHERIIDLSKAAAAEIGMLQTGVARVRVEYLPEQTEKYWADNKLNVPVDVNFTRAFPYKPLVEEDVTTVARDDTPPEMKDAAPLMAVSANELKPDDLKIRPIQPRFSVISDANASQLEAHDLQPLTTPSPEATPPGQPKVLNVGKALNERETGADGGPKIVRIGQKPAPVQDENDAADTQEETPAPATPKMKQGTLGVLKTSPAPVPSVVSTAGGWYVQAGAFSSAANAQSLGSRLKSLGGVEVAPVETGGKTLHRVRVGPFSSRESAEEALGRVSSQGASDAKIIHIE